MKRTKTILWMFFLLVAFSSCRKELEPKQPADPTDPNASLLDMEIPADFKFQTASNLTLNFSGFKSSAADDLIKYSVYLYNPEGKEISSTASGDDGDPVTQTGTLADAMSDLVYTHLSSSANFDLHLTVPSYYDSIYIVKNDMADYATELLPVNNNKIAVDFSAAQSKAPTNNFKAQSVDMFYGVNSLSELFTINSETGEMTVISELPWGMGGSWACALDPVKEIVYTVGINWPYYLYAYEINNDRWRAKGSIGYSGPRLGYNINDGLLYFSFDYWVLKIDPSRGRMLSYYEVKGLDETDGGDLTFSADGTMYISTTSGLYRCEYADNNTINATRISAESLPNYPNSLTYDSKGIMWWASNVNPKGKVFVMDDVTGGWEDRFSDYDHYIHDLATLPLDEELIPKVDSDNDGTIDFYDEYPNDNQKAYNIYTPSIYGLGSYAFEDLWPSVGDFDFNDLVINYRYTHVMNTEGQIFETVFDFIIKNVGGSFRNGFGLQLDCDEDLISEVTGYNLTKGLVSLNAKGLENNQSKPVIIVFDDAWANVNVNNGKMRISVKYNQPIQMSQMGELNPFIFIDGDRGREVHLVDMAPTDLMNTSDFGTKDDDSDPSIGRYYRTSNNLPWAINIVHDFVLPKEKTAINKGYTKFASWAVSGGADFDDWYKDQSDYRDYNYLDNN